MLYEVITKAFLIALEGTNVVALLFEPFEPYIKEDHIYIIPDDVIGIIPFEALVWDTTQINTFDFRKLSYP